MDMLVAKVEQQYFRPLFGKLLFFFTGSKKIYLYCPWLATKIAKNTLITFDASGAGGGGGAGGRGGLSGFNIVFRCF